MSDEKEKSLRGAHRLLTESMIPYHIENEAGLLQRLPEYKAVILPDQRYLPPELARRAGRLGARRAAR